MLVKYSGFTRKNLTTHLLKRLRMAKAFPVYCYIIYMATVVAEAIKEKQTETLSICRPYFKRVPKKSNKIIIIILP